MDQNKLNILKDFIAFCKAELNIQTLPKVSLLNDKKFVEEFRSFGEYNPQTNAIKIVALNRNLADICRSLAHELCHHRQNELGMLYNEAGDTGTDIENDANAMAGILMRDYGKKNVAVYDLGSLEKSKLREISRRIEFTLPNFEYEWEEAARYPEFFPNKQTWLKAVRSGQVQNIDCSMNIHNTDMCDGDLDDLEPAKAARAKQALEKGTVELPIVLKLKNNYELVAGNTRLTALATYGLPTKAWVIDMKMLNEAEQVSSGVWYHGSTADIQQADLDPLFRQNKGKEFMSAKAAGEGNTGSQNGVGIYFGKDKNCKDSFCPMSYTGFYSEYAKEGFMYEMKLKPDAKIINKSDLHNISSEALKKFREEGVDALVSGSELNLLNPDAIESFKKIMQWKKAPALYPIVRGKAQTEQKVTFNSNEELLDYLKKELGDYKLAKVGDKQIYQPTDDNIDKSFQFTSDKKWFNV